MTPGTYVDLALDNAAAHVERGENAAVELRLGVAVPELCGGNMFVTAVSEVELQGPGLVLRLCDP